MVENANALEFFLTRRSRPARTLTGPPPDRDQLMTILTAAARSPDHGMLEPWRFVVLEQPALKRVAKIAQTRGVEKGLEPVAIEKARSLFAGSPLIVAVVSSPQESEKIPQVEQTLSAGAVCLSLLNAALASGWGANWLTSWLALDREFLSSALDLEEHEFVAGFIHLGVAENAPPERARPDVTEKTTWISS